MQEDNQEGYKPNPDDAATIKLMVRMRIGLLFLVLVIAAAWKFLF